MSIDMGYPQNNYRQILGSINTTLRTIQNKLLSDLNLNKIPGAIDYEDIWEFVVTDSLVGVDEHLLVFDKIRDEGGEFSEFVSERSQALIGMSMKLDEYHCKAPEVLGRIVDTIWAFGNGTAYVPIYKSIDDGEGNVIEVPDSEAVKKYIDELTHLMEEINDYVNAIPPEDENNNLKIDLHKDWLISKLTGSEHSIKTIKANILIELDKAYNLLSETMSALKKDYMEAFKICTGIPLYFSMNSKIDRIQKKMNFGDDGGVGTRLDKFCYDQAQIYKVKVLPDRSNYQACMNEAHKASFMGWGTHSAFDNYVDLTWERNIPAR